MKVVYVVYVLFDLGNGHGTTEQIGGEFPTFRRCAQYLYNLTEPEPGWLKRPPLFLSCERQTVLANRP
jgi:hypothetical protein